MVRLLGQWPPVWSRLEPAKAAQLSIAGSNREENGGHSSQTLALRQRRLSNKYKKKYCLHNYPISMLQGVITLGTMTGNNVAGFVKGARPFNGARLFNGASGAIATCPQGQCRSRQGDRTCCSPVIVNGRRVCPQVCPE
jgi:hypothetical protein